LSSLNARTQQLFVVPGLEPYLHRWNITSSSDDDVEYVLTCQSVDGAKDYEALFRAWIFKNAMK